MKENKFYKSLAGTDRIYTEVRLYNKSDSIKVQIEGKSINRDYGFSCELFDEFNDFCNALKEIFVNVVASTKKMKPTIVNSLHKGSDKRYIVCQVRLMKNGRLKFQIPSNNYFNRSYGYTIEINEKSGNKKEFMQVIRTLLLDK